jgi:hypothetical protein
VYGLPLCSSSEKIRHSPVVRELKVIGVMGKNGEEEFQAQPAVKREAKWTLENLRRRFRARKRTGTFWEPPPLR